MRELEWLSIKVAPIASVLIVMGLVSFMVPAASAGDKGSPATPTNCFESREGATSVTRIDNKEDWPNVKCSPDTKAVLWWGDPFDGTEPMGDMPEALDGDFKHEEAVVKPRATTDPKTKKLAMYMPCTLCHAAMPVKENVPRELNPIHAAVVPDPLDMKHGKGAIWCLDCHNATNRDTLISHKGEEISFNQSQLLCGKCHGTEFRSWRDGLHGKRIGMWVKGGKKRWWVCTECHNPHNVEPGYTQIQPERAPVLPKGMTNADHERMGHGGSHSDDAEKH